MASAVWRLGVPGSVHAELEEALLAPVPSPRVSHDPIFRTLFAFTFSDAVPDDNNTMIDFILNIRALKLIFSNYAAVVGLQSERNEDGRTKRLVLKDGLHFFVSHVVPFQLAAVFERGWVSRSFTIYVLVLGVKGWVVECFENSLICSELKSLVHPTAFASIVLFVAINQLLD